jgi:tellurite resistance protein TehA-like permease
MFKVIGVATGIFMWLIAFWFSALATVSVLVSARESHFTLNYWAYVFPNAGLVIALVQIANVLSSDGMKGVCSGATVVLVVLWFFVAIMNIRAVVKGQVLWPGMDEDKEDIEGNQHESDEEQNELAIQANGCGA